MQDLLMEKNSTTTQIANSHVDNYEEMKEGNYSIPHWDNYLKFSRF
jgi:hypothetical protein